MYPLFLFVSIVTKAWNQLSTAFSGARLLPGPQVVRISLTQASPGLSSLVLSFTLYVEPQPKAYSVVTLAKSDAWTEFAKTGTFSSQFFWLMFQTSLVLKSGSSLVQCLAEMPEDRRNTSSSSPVTASPAWVLSALFGLWSSSQPSLRLGSITTCGCSFAFWGWIGCACRCASGHLLHFLCNEAAKS